MRSHPTVGTCCNWNVNTAIFLHKRTSKMKKVQRRYCHDKTVEKLHLVERPMQIEHAKPVIYCRIAQDTLRKEAKSTCIISTFNLFSDGKRNSCVDIRKIYIFLTPDKNHRRDVYLHVWIHSKDQLAAAFSALLFFGGGMSTLINFLGTHWNLTPLARPMTSFLSLNIHRSPSLILLPSTSCILTYE